MIRFKPDTLWDGLLRYIAMAAPESNVYIEIAAPDIRFIALTVLALAFLIWRARARERRPGTSASLALLILVLASTVPWLLTSGNGRYWIPMLLCAGPLLAAMAWQLPMAVGSRLAIVAALLGTQGFMLSETPPWGAWAYLDWKDPPYFQVTPPRVEAGAAPVTYVTVSSISYSLIAPQFAPSSRWINITAGGAVGRDAEWTATYLRRAAAGPMRLVVPTIREAFIADGQPNEEMRRSIDALLAPQRLGLDPGARCDLAKSTGMAAIQTRLGSAKRGENAGFWICPLIYPVQAPPAEPGGSAEPPAQVTQAFEQVERACPRFFPPGARKSVAIADGWLRQYADSDMKLYVLNDGHIMYKYWRALNPVAIGTVEQWHRGRGTLDCRNIRGRSGLPWDREI